MTLPKICMQLAWVEVCAHGAVGRVHGDLWMQFSNTLQEIALLVTVMLAEIIHPQRTPEHRIYLIARNTLLRSPFP